MLRSKRKRSKEKERSTLLEIKQLNRLIVIFTNRYERIRAMQLRFSIKSVIVNANCLRGYLLYVKNVRLALVISFDNFIRNIELKAYKNQDLATWSILSLTNCRKTLLRSCGDTYELFDTK